MFHATSGSQVHRAATEQQFDRFTARQRKDQTFSAILDSGANVHTRTLAEAEDLFQSKGVSNLKVIGLNGVPARADLAGHLIVVVWAPSAEQYQIDLGQAHAMRSCPMNFVECSLLIRIGATIH